MVVKTVRSAAAMAARVVNEVVSFVVFSALDLLDVVLCLVYKVVDYAVEAEWKPCYCSSAKDMITSSGKILVSENGGLSKVVCLCSRKLQLEDISDTLYSRPSLVSDVSHTTVRELRRIQTERRPRAAARAPARSATTTFTINSTIVEMLQGRIGGQQSHPIPRWSDCDCKFCNSWSSAPCDSVFVHTAGPRDVGAADEDVVFIHGFISSLAFWTETVFPNFTELTRARFLKFVLMYVDVGLVEKTRMQLR